MMLDRERSPISWIDVLWLVFLGGLALLPPLFEIHKQLTLLAIGIFQLLEGWLIKRIPRRGAAYSVAIKIVLATLLLDHTGEMGINSNYYPILYLPVVSAALYFGTVGALAWTTVASLAYVSLLYPALQEYELTREGATVLTSRILFFFIAAILVNQFAIENRRQVQRLQDLSETLEETNRQLRRVEAEARRAERLAALGQLSAGLAHEIRNPLGVIKGSAEMLNQKLQESNPLASELAGYISTEVNRLSALVSRFLDFARPLHTELTPQDITPVLDRSLQLVATMWKGGPVAVERHYPEDLPTVPLDESLCEQAFVNIIQNAYDAMGSEGGRLSVAAEISRSLGRDGIEVRLCDSGPGVPEDLREQIFNPFVTTKKTGVGLGLSIVSKIIDGHQGWIKVESGHSPDNTQLQGACFVMFFPFAVETVNS